MVASHSESWLLLGDFTSVISQTKKRGGRSVSSSSSGGLRQFISQCGLVDLGFNGNPFTWNNGRGDCVNIGEKLDRGLANHDW